MSPFLDMHDLGDALVRARFADPVDRRGAPDRYLRSSPGPDAGPQGHRGPQLPPTTARGASRDGGDLRAMEQAYEVHRRDGRLPASYEVVYGHAWAPEQRQIDGGVAIPVSAVRRQAST